MYENFLLIPAVEEQVMPYMLVVREALVHHWPFLGKTVMVSTMSRTIPIIDISIKPLRSVGRIWSLLYH